jgi:hypothetical protein
MAVRTALLKEPGGQRWLCASLGLLFLVAAGLLGYQCATAKSSTLSSPLRLRTSPISISLHPQRCLRIAEEDLRKIRDQVQPLDEGLSASLYLHALRVFGLDFAYQRGPLASSRETLRLFSDDVFGRRILGTALLVTTPRGIRCTPHRNQGARESHRDYCLAVLSELGTPISFPITIAGKSFTFKDMLADSLANCHLGQEEIEWTALTYAMWLPPERTWVNKFGDSFSFDQLAVELMQRPLDETTCAGTHVVQAMIVLARVDREECAILSPEVRSKLLDRLATIVREIEATQAADGSWGPDWCGRLVDRADAGYEKGDWSVDSGGVEARLLATSHIPELLMLLPEELRLSEERLARSGGWLHAQLKGVSSDFVRSNFCPCTHGALVLQRICRRADESVVDRAPKASTHSVHGENER